MGKHLSKPLVDTIVEMLDGWPTGTKLTWDALIKRIAKRMRIRPSRQTLARHERIQSAFRMRKAGLREEVDPGPNDRVLAQQLRRVTAENARLREENERYRQRFAQWHVQRLQAGSHEARPRGAAAGGRSATLGMTDIRRMRPGLG